MKKLLLALALVMSMLLVGCNKESIEEKAQKQAILTLQESAVNPKSISIENIKVIDAANKAKSVEDDNHYYSYSVLNFDAYGDNAIGGTVRNRIEYIYLIIEDNNGNSCIMDTYYNIAPAPFSSSKVKESVTELLNRHTKDDIDRKGLTLGWYAIRTVFNNPHMIKQP